MTNILLQAPLCRICGKPNECAVSAANSLETECWCQKVGFTEALLAAVAKELKGWACICRSGAEGRLLHNGQGT
jgi:hypothetical protein